MMYYNKDASKIMNDILKTFRKCETVHELELEKFPASMKWAHYTRAHFREIPIDVVQGVHRWINETYEIYHCLLEDDGLKNIG